MNKDLIDRLEAARQRDLAHAYEVSDDSVRVACSLLEDAKREIEHLSPEMSKDLVGFDQFTVVKRCLMGFFIRRGGIYEKDVDEVAYRIVESLTTLGYATMKERLLEIRLDP